MSTDINDILDKKYQRQYAERMNQRANGFKYKPDINPKKGMLRIHNGLNAKDTVTVPIEQYFRAPGQFEPSWHPFKVGFKPEVSNKKIGFYFEDGDKRILQYKNVYKWTADHYVGQITPDEDLYQGYPTRNFKIPMPDLENFDTEQGKGE